MEKAQAAWEAEVKEKKTAAKLPKPVADILAVEPAKRTDKQKQAIAAHYRTIAPALEPLRKELAATQKHRDDLVKTIPSTLVAMAGPPRTLRILARGNWQDDSGEIVQPDVPAFLTPRLGERDPKTPRYSRLDLAKWLTAADHPLTSRVFVNRLWKLMFGQGLVKSLDDFGSQGAPPSHPQLLDYLASEFTATGWDVKAMVKWIAMSATYRPTYGWPARTASAWTPRRSATTP